MMAITLAKGQGLSLEKSQHNLSLVTIGLGWDIAEKRQVFWEVYLEVNLQNMI
jgi:stress response protein SCP2